MNTLGALFIAILPLAPGSAPFEEATASILCKGSLQSVTLSNRVQGSPKEASKLLGVSECGYDPAAWSPQSLAKHWNTELREPTGGVIRDAVEFDPTDPTSKPRYILSPARNIDVQMLLDLNLDAANPAVNSDELARRVLGFVQQSLRLYRPKATDRVSGLSLRSEITYHPRFYQALMRLLTQTKDGERARLWTLLSYSMSADCANFGIYGRTNQTALLAMGGDGEKSDPRDHEGGVTVDTPWIKSIVVRRVRSLSCYPFVNDRDGSPDRGAIGWVRGADITPKL